jgi:hypothetical protein
MYRLCVDGVAGVREGTFESARLCLWQRDKHQCVKGGSRERLEFDHIIPAVAESSSTERNVQLLCEAEFFATEAFSPKNYFLDIP